MQFFIHIFKHVCWDLTVCKVLCDHSYADPKQNEQSAIPGLPVCVCGGGNKTVTQTLWICYTLSSMYHCSYLFNSYVIHESRCPRKPITEISERFVMDFCFFRKIYVEILNQPALTLYLLMKHKEWTVIKTSAILLELARECYCFNDLYITS